MSIYARVPTPGCGCAATQSLYEPDHGIKSVNPELHKVTLQVARRLPENQAGLDMREPWVNE